MKILIATKNLGKTRETKEILGDFFDCVSLVDLRGSPEIEETGKTFEENSFLKAKSYFDWSAIPTIADDGGLEIDALHGEPGVLSRRWPSFAEASEGKPGREKTDEELIQIALQKLQGVPREKRTARLRVVVTYHDGTRTLSDSQSIEGYIMERVTAKCEPGYPFRAIFWIPEHKKLFQDLTHNEHEAINHRRRALKNIAEKILK